MHGDEVRIDVGPIPVGGTQRGVGAELAVNARLADIRTVLAPLSL
jgi:hypothetical protein